MEGHHHVYFIFVNHGMCVHTHNTTHMQYSRALSQHTAGMDDVYKVMCGDHEVASGSAEEIGRRLRAHILRSGDRCQDVAALYKNGRAFKTYDGSTWSQMIEDVEVDDLLDAFDGPRKRRATVHTRPSKIMRDSDEYSIQVGEELQDHLTYSDLKRLTMSLNKSARTNGKVVIKNSGRVLKRFGDGAFWNDIHRHLIMNE